MSPLFGPSADKILSTGAPVAGIVTGIEVKTTHDDPAQRYEEYRVEAAGSVYGIRQDLAPQQDVRLGMPVTLRVDGKNAVIEWGENHLNRWKTITPPAPGIVDDHDHSDNRGALTRAKKGQKPVTITILEFVKRPVALGLGTALDARCRVDPASGEPYEAIVQHLATPPGYASHLPVVGARLPAWETKGFFGGEGIMVDWPAAATANPGVGEPSAIPSGQGLLTGVTVGGTGLGGLLGGIVADTEAVQSTEPPAEGEMPEIPEYAKKLMQKFGVDTEQFTKGGDAGGDAAGDTR